MAKLGATLTIKDNVSATLKIIKKEQEDFRKSVDRTRIALERIYNRKYQIRLNNTAATRNLNNLKRSLAPFRRKLVIAMAYKDMVTSRIKSVNEKLRSFSKQVFSPVVKIKDKTVGTFSSVKKGFSKLKDLDNKYGVSEILSSGAELEKQQISMKHLIGINNQDLDESGVQKVTDDFMKQLRDNAKITPFSSTEVVEAGSKALELTGGNTSEAMSLVKIAEDMASLNPGKDINMAIEALADAKNGDVSKLKEFNAKVSDEELQELGLMGVVDKKLKSQFEGGTATLSKSASGMWSTMTGFVDSTLQDLGLKVIESLLPHLEKLIEWMNASGPTIDTWVGHISTGIGWVIDKAGLFLGKVLEYLPMAGEVVGSVVGWITDKFGWLGEKIFNLNIDWVGAWEGIKSVMGTAWEFIEPILSLISEGVRFLWEAFEWAFPAIQATIETVWSIVKPILEGLGAIIGWVGDGIGKLADWIGGEREPKSQERLDRDRRFREGVRSRHFNGIERVPYNNYNAILHKDEAVIPARNNPYIGNGKVNNPINININGVNKSTNEIVNELVPQLKLALSNM
ncbi:hypothetical protein [uncultured Tissierella sp.]|uniref:hypothetical protein n=1 Tax=uncultured Tissierella sp. TaxID=448160 RepID=UPI002803A012|nr:hypothetical protein [uncultured Tissierella sp.]MDU5082808.1 hypothetical protein [Bacillota bacterium]